jgi:hypothetical protein
LVTYSIHTFILQSRNDISTGSIEKNRNKSENDISKENNMAYADYLHCTECECKVVYYVGDEDKEVLCSD